LRWDGKPWQAQNTGDNPAAFQRFGVGDTMGEPVGRAGAAGSNLTQVLLRRATGEDDGTRRFGAMPNYQAMMSQTYGKDAFVTPSRCISEALPSEGEYDPEAKAAYTVRACETQRLRNVLLEQRKKNEQRKKKNHSLVEWLADANRAGRLLSYHQNLYRFRAGRRMYLYWRDGDQQWFYVVEPGVLRRRTGPGAGDIETTVGHH